MHLIIGGAYQGKREYAKAQFGFAEEEIVTCTGDTIGFPAKAVDRLSAFTLACVRAGKSPIDYFKQHKEQWQNAVLICDDLFCGVVPLSAENRAWRQETGLLCQYLSQEAETVTRIFCGLPQRLK